MGGTPPTNVQFVVRIEHNYKGNYSMLNGNGQGKSALVHNRIFIEEDKEFTLDEFAHLVARAVRSVASVDIDKDEVIYTRDDVYFTIIDVLGYINERTPGRFKFDQTTFQNYLVHYIPDAIQKRKKTKGLLISKAQTALHIKAEKGELPVWAVNDSAIMDLITNMESVPKEAPTHLVQKSAETRQQTDEQIDALAHEAVRVYRKIGEIPETVTSNVGVLKKFTELINNGTEGSDV